MKSLFGIFGTYFVIFSFATVAAPQGETKAHNDYHEVIGEREFENLHPCIKACFMQKTRLDAFNYALIMSKKYVAAEVMGKLQWFGMNTESTRLNCIYTCWHSETSASGD